MPNNEVQLNESDLYQISDQPITGGTSVYLYCKDWLGGETAIKFEQSQLKEFIANLQSFVKD